MDLSKFLNNDATKCHTRRGQYLILSYQAYIGDAFPKVKTLVGLQFLPHFAELHTKTKAMQQ